MATHYLRARCLLELSDTSDYAGARTPVRPIVMELTPTCVIPGQEVSAKTTGTTIELSDFTTPTTMVVIENRDAANYVTLAYTDNGTANSVKIPAGDWVKVCTATVSADLVLTANTAACACTVWVAGAVA